MQNIEVEVKSLIAKEKYEELIEFFNKEGKFLKEDYQETYYFDCAEDVRIQKNNFFSKIVMKSGKVHDEQREELEIKFPKEDFENLERIFAAAGVNVKIKWFRNRLAFEWNDLSVMLDYTKGYGYIIEVEKMSDDAGKEEALKLIKQKLVDLKVDVTPRVEFDKKFAYYRENWRTLI